MLDLVDAQEDRSDRFVAQVHLTDIRCNLGILFSLTEGIDKLRRDQECPELNAHDDRQIFDIIESMMELTYDIKSHLEAGVGVEPKPLSEIVQELRTIGQVRYRTPLASDLASLFSIFDSLHRAQLLSLYYWTRY